MEVQKYNNLLSGEQKEDTSTQKRFRNLKDEKIVEISN